jgi:hypothetical protein
MTRLIQCGWFVTALATLLSFPDVHAEDQRETEGSGQELTQPFVDDITMLSIREDGSRILVSEPRLLMHTYDPERGSAGDHAQSAAIWAWGTGRPVAITVFWRWQQREGWGNSFISTSPGKVAAICENRTWNPEEPGLQFARLEDAPTPADSLEDRTFQMSQIARRFSGREFVGNRSLDLRILSGPMHRYQTDGVTGAIFGLARNESPYAFLFLEAVSDPIEPSYWRYGWIKGTSSPVTVQLDGDELLQIPGSLAFLGSPTEPFWVFFRHMPTELREPVVEQEGNGE